VTELDAVAVGILIGNLHIPVIRAKIVNVRYGYSRSSVKKFRFQVLTAASIKVAVF
jgi:hypothetical protein